MTQTRNTFFKRLTLTTTVAVYFLILVGGIVRSTGSGMGCPDWPKCFGSYVPPTSADELPVDYKEVFTEIRLEKNQRLANFLRNLGFINISRSLLQEEAIAEETEFNVAKTWTEYVNRLIGAVIGLLILLTFLFSLKYWKTERKFTVTSFIVLLLVIIQGWIGSVVVSTNLLPWMITVHMFLALLIVCLLILLTYWVYKDKLKAERIKQRPLVSILVFSLVLLAIQIALGTQVRESVDNIAKLFEYEARNSWIEQLGIAFFIHRSFSIIILVVNVILVYSLLRLVKFKQGVTYTLGIGIMALIVAEVITGALMSYFGIPPFLQPIHLLFGTVAFGLQFLMLLVMINSKELDGIT